MTPDRRSIPLPFADNFAAAASLLPGLDLPWLTELRTRSAARFVRFGLPTQRVERWKYTNLNALAATQFSMPGARLDPTALSLHASAMFENSYRLVFENGRLRRDLSSSGALPSGLHLMGLAEVLAEDPESMRAHLSQADNVDDALSLLNLAFMSDGAVLRIDPGAVIETPIELIHIGSPGDQALAIHCRNWIVAGPDSKATIVESFSGEAVYWSGQTTQISLMERVELRHYKSQAESSAAFHTATANVQMARGSNYESFVLSTGAALSRNEINIVLDGEGASCTLGGSYLMRQRQHVDNTTEIIHARPHTTSKEVYKGVLDDQSRGVFQGRIVVQPDAQKSDGHQLNKTILLSDRAEIDSKPELEIYADDVKCSHGATAGELDDDALFYLRARGIDVSAARRMLVTAFVGDAIETISHGAVRAAFGRQVDHWMTADGARL